MSNPLDCCTGEDGIMGDQSYRYLTVDEMKSLGDDSMPMDVTGDERRNSGESLFRAGIRLDGRPDVEPN
jgi:hypothetical protein